MASQVFDSLAALQAQHPITAQTTSAITGVQLLRDEKNNFYLLDPAGDRSLPKGTQIGAYGGGKLAKRDASVLDAIPFVLNSDKDIAQLAPPEGRVQATTMYQILRQLETAGTFNIKITGHGLAKPKTVGGAKCYDFEGGERDDEVDFVLTAREGQSKVSQGNFFNAGARRGNFAPGSALSPIFRLSFDPVGASLKPMKPLVATNRVVRLTMGKPVKVAWYPAAQ